MSTVRESIWILTVTVIPAPQRNSRVLDYSAGPEFKLVAEASNGYEAIQQLRVHYPDITLMDLQMPDMNGADAMIAIRGEFAPGLKSSY